MSAISGLKGSVTFAAGYTEIVDSWSAIITALQQDMTPLAPAGDHRQLFQTMDLPDETYVDILRSGMGNYTCKLAVPSEAVSSGITYVGAAESWLLTSICGVRDITPLGADWRTFVTGLRDTSFESVHYLDDTAPLPPAGSKGTVTLTADTGDNYTIPAILSEVDAGVSTEDIMRRARLVGDAYAAATNNNLPLAGDAGNAVLVAETGRQYSGDIIVVGVTCSVNRQLSVGGLSVDFVFNGEIVRA